MSNLYETLGVSKDATQDKIKKAYRDAAFKYHPDKNPGNTAAEEQFKKINAAYDILGDSVKRADYDRYGDTNYNQTQNREYGSYEDIFEQWRSQQNSQRRYTYTYYGPTYSNNRNFTKSDAFAMLFRGVLTAGLGLFFFRFSIWFGIFGLLACIGAIVNGITTAVSGLKYLFTQN